MKKYFIIGFMLIIIAAVLLFSGSKSFNGILKSNGAMFSDSQSFTLKESNENSLTGQSGEETLKIKYFKETSNEKAKEITDGQLALINTMFEAQSVPYPEFLTNSTECNDRFKPQKKDLKNGKLELLFAGERLTYGICTEEYAKYKSGVGFFYCEKPKTLFRVDYLIPKEKDFKQIENLTESFSCL